MLNRLKKQKNRLHELLLLGLVALPQASHAAAAQTIDIESILYKITDYLQGGVARALGLVAIIGAGYMCIVKQQLPKEQFGMILLGLGIIFGGSSLYTAWVG